MPPLTTKHRGILESEGSQEHKSLGSSSEDGATPKPLSLWAKMAYSVGHVLNDLTASVWFTYMLVYLDSVVDLGPVIAGNLILLGQVADAVSNPLIGYLSDRADLTCLRTCGRRKKWHLIGTICVVLAFPFLLTSCLSCGPSTPYWILVLFYVLLIVIFQFGWASTQIAHLSLITELSVYDKERLELNAMRYGWTVISNIIVYGVTWGLFQRDSVAASSNDIQPEDATSFLKLAVIIVAIGLFATLIFYIGTPVPLSVSRDFHQSNTENETHPQTTNQQIRNRRGQRSWKDWVMDPHFYVLSLLYICARLIMNLTQVYIPFFVTQTLDLDKNTIATYPLVMCVFSFLTAAMMKFLASRCTSELLYMWGSVNVVAASLWMIFLQPHLEVSTFGTAILSGIGAAAAMVTSLSMVSEYIGLDTASSAFVFGLMGFADKLCNGIAVISIQILSPCTNDGSESEECRNYFRIAIAYVPGGAALLSLVFLALAVKIKGSRKKPLEDQVLLLEEDNNST